MSIYPNPADDYVIIQADLPLTTDVVVEVKDISGRIVAGAINVADEHNISVSLVGLNPGIYFVTLRGKMGFWQEKLVIR